MTPIGERAETASKDVPVHVEDTVQAVARFHAAHEADASPLQRFIERATRRAGSPRFIALLTIGFQVMKAAVDNPVKSLRTE